MIKATAGRISIIHLLFRVVYVAQSKQGTLVANICASSIAAALINPALLLTAAWLLASDAIQADVTPIGRGTFFASLLASLILALVMFRRPQREERAGSASAPAKELGAGARLVALVAFMVPCIVLTILGVKQPLACLAMTALCLLPVIRYSEDG